MPVSSTGDELERLSVSLNRMITRLDDAFQNSKRFVADASHDLRTPLTILRGELENFAEDPRLDAELRDRAGSMLEEVVHLGKIVEQLFTLSRLDAGEAQTEWTRFDLAELAKTTAEQMSLLAEDKGISISCDASQPVPVKGNHVRLKQVVVNLLDNAIKYTPAKGAIQLRVLAVNGHAVLEVEDNGIGIPPEALPHVFERFYRVDQARSARFGSAGLGTCPSSNPSARRTARRWRCKAPSATAVVFASNCRCSATATFPDRYMKLNLVNRLEALQSTVKLRLPGVLTVILTGIVGAFLTLHRALMKINLAHRFEALQTTLKPRLLGVLAVILIGAEQPRFQGGLKRLKPMGKVDFHKCAMQGQKCADDSGQDHCQHTR